MKLMQTGYAWMKVSRCHNLHVMSMEGNVQPRPLTSPGPLEHI